MKEKQMMIDYHNEDEDGFERKPIDDNEFCVRQGDMYFMSDGERYCIPLERCSQVYMT